jgi:hypothetical protein
LKLCQHHNFMVPRLLVQVLHLPQNFENPTIAIFRTPLQRIMFHVKLVYVLDFSLHRTLFVWVHRSAWNKTCILNVNRLPCSYFWLVTKMVLLKTIHPLKTNPHTKCHGPALTSASFASTSEVWTSAILEWLKLGIKNYAIEVTFNGMTSILVLYKFNNWLNIWWEDGQTRQDGDLVSLLFSLGREVS